MASKRRPTRDSVPIDALVKREQLRLVGAVAGLLAAALLMAGGLLWREHARARPHVRPASVTAAR